VAEFFLFLGNGAVCGGDFAIGAKFEHSQVRKKREMKVV
jgi:hypothetical protein